MVSNKINVDNSDAYTFTPSRKSKTYFPETDYSVNHFLDFRVGK